MRVTTTPTKVKLLNEKDRDERSSRTNVTILDFEPKAPVSRIDCSDANHLSAILNGPAVENDQVHARLFIVEDLSRDVIEQLGSRFNVDPLFFREHVSDYIWYNSRDPWVDLPNLDIHSRKRSYAHVRYVQTRYFRSQKSLRRARWEAGGFNVLRRVDEDGNWVRGADIEGSNVGLVRSRTSFWVRPNKEGETGVLSGSLATLSAEYFSRLKWD